MIPGWLFDALAFCLALMGGVILFLHVLFPINAYREQRMMSEKTHPWASPVLQVHYGSNFEMESTKHVLMMELPKEKVSIYEVETKGTKVSVYFRVHNMDKPLTVSVDYTSDGKIPYDELLNKIRVFL